MRHVLIFAARYGIAGALILTGQIVLVASNPSRGAGWEGWGLFTGAGVSVLLFNLLFRIGSQGEGEREREEAARRYFERHGRWPDGD
jgi:hypothetical protein